MSSLRAYVRTLNLFRSANGAEEHEDEYEEHTNVIATRIYLILLFIILLGTILGILLIPYASIIIVKNPTRTQFESLPDSTCSCSRISLSFNQFVSSETTFHQLCSSDFVLNQWISSIYFGNNSAYFAPSDFRSSGFAQFRALASFCRLSQENVNQSLLIFGSTSFISSRVLSEPVFQLQVEGIINRFKLTIPNTFKTQIELISKVIMSNQLINGLGTSNLLVLYSDEFTSYFEVWWCLHFYEDGNFCRCKISPVCPGSFGFHDEFDEYTLLFPPRTFKMYIPGLRSGCMPVDAILSSSLECFYNQTCVDAIISYLNIPTNFTAMNKLTSSSFPINSTVEVIVGKLMVEDWNFNVSYDKYYNQCAPTSCTYLKMEQRRFLYVLTTLIGLLGGLCEGLGIILPPVVRFIRRRRSTTNAVLTARISSLDRLRRLKIVLKRVLIELNLFKIDQNDQRQIFQQRIMTRIYIVLISSAFVIITLYSSIRLEIQQEIVYNPSESQFLHLQSLYPTSLRCPCSSVSIPYNGSLTIEPHYHQICSSDFISSASLTWFSSVIFIEGAYLDFTNTASSHFHTLATLCQLANKTITNALELFLQEEFVTSEVISRELFDSQAKELMEDWRQGIINNFLQTFQLIRVIQLGNHLGSAFSNFMVNSNDSGELLFDSINLYGENCTCLLSASCRALIGIYRFDISVYPRNLTLLFQIPGFFTGCYKMEALLASTLECFYSKDCLHSLNSALVQSNEYQTPMNINTLLNASLNQANETINLIVNRLFVDEWSSNISFSTYYQTCSPSSCTFEKTRYRNFFSVLTTVISVLGGLTTGLEILFFIFLRILVKIRMEQPFYAHLYSINIWFRNLFNRERLANRLRNLFLVITLIVLFFLSLFTRQNQTIEYSKPSLEIYEQLFHRFPTVLQCPCSKISIEYKHFMNLTVPSQHQICSSDFVSNQWFAKLIVSHHLSQYSSFDFRNAAIGHFQLLDFLCQLTQQHLNYTYFGFARKNFISSQIVSSVAFDEQIQSIIKEFQLTTFKSFSITLQLVRDLISDNTLVPIFQTNWKWISPIEIPCPTDMKSVYMEPLTYGNCTCGLSSQCVQPGIISNKPILGLMVGCYPLESLLKSTFECLYDATCFSQLQTSNESFTPLNVSLASRYSINDTVESILKELMIEEWSKNISYKKYYTECAPFYCSYSYLGYPPTIEIFTDLLGLYGGLMIITKVVVSAFITLWRDALQRPENRIQPEAVPQ